MRSALALAAVFCLSTCTGEGSVTPSEPAVVALQQGLLDQLGSADEVAVIINFRDPATGAMDKPLRKSLYGRLQDQLLERAIGGLKLSRRFMHVPALAARIDRSALEQLRALPEIESIQLDGSGGGALKESVPAIGASLVQSMYGLTGKGVVVAVLDSGVVSKHPDLSDSVVAQHCFTQRDCPPNRTTEGESAEDNHGHGTNVAGIISSNGVVSGVGFAPGSDLVILKIDDRNNAGQVSDWVAGLDWVYDNLATLKVKVMNLSICTTALYPDAGQCDSQEPALARSVKNLIDAGVVIFSASGNQGNRTSMAAPACNTGVVAVAATYDSNVGQQPPDAATYAARYGSGVANCGDATTDFDQITCFSNTPKRVDLVTTGAPMTSDGLNNATETYRGTSQASPTAAGVAALMLECNPMLTPDQIKRAMVETGVMKTDPKNGNAFPSLRALAAVQRACPNLANGMGTAGSAAGGSAGGAGTSAGTAAGLAAGSGGGLGAAGLASAAGSGGQVGTPGGAGAAGSSPIPPPPVSTTPSPGATGTLVNGVNAAGAGNQPVGTASGMAERNSSCSCDVPGRRRAGDAGAASAAALGLLSLLGTRLQRRRSRIRRTA